MAHELDFTSTGEARMVSLNENPWHKLGKVVTKEMTDDELMQLSGMNWAVNRQDVYDANQKKVEGYKLLSRSEDDAHFGIVSDRYRVFQNTELVALMREIAGNTPLIWETAGVLHHGKTVWAMARIPELKITVGKSDEIFPYMLLTNGHGNKRPLEILPTAVRVVCANTIGMALHTEASNQSVRRGNVESGNFSREAVAEGFALKHTSSLDILLKDVIAAYKNVRDDVQATQLAFNTMVNITVNYKSVKAYWDDVFGEPPLEEQVTAKDAYGARIAELTRIYNSPTCTMDGIGGSLYSAYQAATEYVDHGKINRKRTVANAAGLAYAAFGDGASLKREAFTKALALI
jgi:phage/plasmid-like protein (TIGR03299 family)